MPNASCFWVSFICLSLWFSSAFIFITLMEDYLEHTHTHTRTHARTHTHVISHCPWVWKKVINSKLSVVPLKKYSHSPVQLSSSVGVSIKASLCDSVLCLSVSLCACMSVSVTVSVWSPICLSACVCVCIWEGVLGAGFWWGRVRCFRAAARLWSNLSHSFRGIWHTKD